MLASDTGLSWSTRFGIVQGIAYQSASGGIGKSANGRGGNRQLLIAGVDKPEGESP